MLISGLSNEYCFQNVSTVVFVIQFKKIVITNEVTDSKFLGLG